MDRYTQGSILRYYGDNKVDIMQYSVDGDWVRFTDAEAAERAAEERGRQKEREEILRALDETKFDTTEPWLASRTAREVYRACINVVRSRGEKQSGARKPIDPPKATGYPSLDKWILEMTDAFNAMQKDRE